MSERRPESCRCVSKSVKPKGSQLKAIVRTYPANFQAHGPSTMPARVRSEIFPYKPDRNGRTTGPLVAHRASLRRAAAGQLSGVDRTKPRALQPRRMTLPGTPALSAFAPLPGTSRHQTRRPCGNEQSLPGACRADSADTRGVASTGRLPGAGTDDPSSHALPAADSDRPIAPAGHAFGQI